MDDPASERAAIVAWLRSKKRLDFVPMPDEIIPAHWERDDYGNKLFWRGEERRPMKRLASARDYADAIEAGAHLLTQESDNG